MLSIPLNDKMNQQPIAIGRTSKTKEDFLLWLREKRAFEKQAADHAAHSDHFDRRAVMIWVDDGGRTITTPEEAQEPPGG